MIGATLLALLLSLAATAQQSESDEAPPDAFSGFETLLLDNGLKVWYKHLPDDPVVSISVAIPVGSDRDPVGKEQLAHFTEHMLFSDQPGRTEEEIRREIEERGGVYNATVSHSRTFYFVRIGKPHAGFALEWLFRILGPHAMDPQVVERQREPVALEVRARPRQLFDWIRAKYLDPPGLRLPGFWEREFGLETWARRDYYPYASLNSISAEDLRWFYETYYVPSLMTLTVIGDVDLQQVMQVVKPTFGSLHPRLAPVPLPAPLDPNRARRSSFWTYRSNVYYDARFKFYSLPPEDESKLIFLSRFLEKRLNDRLRFGERKATYGLRVGTVKRGRAAYLYIAGGISERQYDFADSVVENELATLQAGRLSEEEFAADRDAVVHQLRVANTSSDDLERWVSGYFYDTRVYRDFPDLGAALENYTKSEIETLVEEYFVPERRVAMIVYPHPISQALLAVLAVALVWGTLYAVRSRLMRPIDMTRIRYVARFRVPRLYRVAVALALVVVLAAAGRLLVFGFQLFTDRFLLGLDSFWAQWSVYGLMLSLLVAALILVLAHIPRKLLVFDDRLLFKYLSYRSVAIPAAAVVELSLLRFPHVWLSRRLWRCVPLALGLLAPAIYVRSESGRAYFFSVRDRTELFELLQQIRAGAGARRSVT